MPDVRHIRRLHTVPEPAVELLRSGVREVGCEDADDEVARTLEVAATSRGLSFVAIDGAEVVGVLFGSLERGGAAAFVRWLVVDPAARRSGVGTALVAALAATPGIERLRGMVDQKDSVASRFWRDLGWTVARPRPGRRRQMMSGDLPGASQAAA
jgi:GNAT superfamily N-acetyltransferase